MAEVGKLYAKGLHKRFSYLATWLPNTNLMLGDVGRLHGEIFTIETTLKELGVPFHVRKGKKPVKFNYTSQSGISVNAKAAGQVATGTTLPQAQAGVSIKFSKEGAFLFQATECKVDEIEDKAELGTAIIALLINKKWNPDWVVVDTLVRAGSATIAVSNSRNAALDLTAKTDVKIANLANLDAGLNMSHQSGDVIQFIAEKGLSPLYKLSRVKQSWIQKLLNQPGEFDRYALIGTYKNKSIESPDKKIPKGKPLETVTPRWDQ